MSKQRALPTLAHHIKTRRLFKEITQKDMANHLNVHSQCICNWERGRAPIPIKYLSPIIELLSLNRNTVYDLIIYDKVMATKLKYKRIIAPRFMGEEEREPHQHSLSGTQS